MDIITAAGRGKKHSAKCTKWCWLALVGMALPLPSWSQERPPLTNLDEQQQRERTQRQAQEQQARRQAPDVRLSQRPDTDFERTDLPAEAKCFKLEHIRLQGDRSRAFGFVQRYLDRYDGRCVGREDISLIVRRAGDLIIDRGYVTTRVGLEDQDLSKGVLTITLVPGTIHAIRMADGGKVGDWRWALPMRPGDLLNLREIEQGLEQMKRVPSQDVNIDIQPADTPGQSDLVITAKRTRPWRIIATLDDSGASETGRYQAGLNVGVDNPLGIGDLLSVGATHDVLSGAGHGTSGLSANYSVPRGDWLFTGSFSDFRYSQTIEGSAQTFRSSGTSRSLDLAAQRLLYRNQDSKTAFEMHIGKRWAHSFIEDVELDSQRRDMSMVEAAIVHRHYVGPAQLDLRLGERFGVPWFGGQRDPADHTHDDPTFKYRLWTLDASLSLPLQVGGQTVQWSSDLHGQYSNRTLYASEFIAVGGRYTVRGFDGDQTLAAERGWYWRNTFSLPIGHWPVAFYTGIDAGRVSGPSAAYLPGNTTLSGAFLGIRGSFAGISWDAFIGKPLHGHAVLENTRPAAGFQLAYTY